MNAVEGRLSAQGKKFGLVAARFNSLITKELVAGARDCLLRHGAQDKDLTVVWVPGAVEIPQALRKIQTGKKFNALIALGCVIRGDTTHYDHVVQLVTQGVGEIADGKIPVAFGVLTTENLQQALERAGSKAGNKGWDAALAAIEMANLWEKL